MHDGQGQHASAGKKINGQELTAGTPSVDIRTAKLRAQETDQETTRYLSAATQLDIEFARSVVAGVVDEKFRALAPTYGIDIAAVAMWAIKAVGVRAKRDYILAAMLVTIALSLALSPLCHWLLILLVPALLTSWLAVAWEHWECIHNVVIKKMLRDRFELSEAPEPPRAADGERLREIRKRRDGNLVVFSGPSAFVGCGKTGYYNRLLLDVSRGEDDSDGNPAAPRAFTTHDLHVALMEAFDEKSGMGKNLHNIKVYERLFVNGKHIQNDPKLLPDRYRPPPTSVDQSRLDEATAHPSPEARTYICVEMPGWQGQLVVTLFVRTVHAGGSLFVEWTFKVLPPLRETFLRIDTYYDHSKSAQLRNSLGSGFITVWPALLRSPRWALKTSRRIRVARHHQERQSDQIRKGYVFDYGARQSIRERASAKAWQRQNYFLVRDQAMYVLLAEKTLTRTVRAFLVEHGVSLSEFEDQIKIIFDNSISVGKIEGSGVVVGHNSSATAQDSTKGQDNSTSK